MDGSLQALLLAKAIFIGIIFAALFVLERVLRAAKPPTSPRRLINNAGLWLIVLIASPLITGALTGIGANSLIWHRPEFLTNGPMAAAMLALDIVILDLWVYWLHRAYHCIPFLWRFHEVHHRDEFLDSTSAVRFHIGEVLISSILRLIPIAVLAAPLSSVIIFEALLLSFALFHHSNMRLPKRVERALASVIVTPSIHWVHHHAIRADTDSNYGGIFSCWDLLFSSKSATIRRLDMKIGAEGVEEMGLFGLLIAPFRKGQG